MTILDLRLSDASGVPFYRQIVDQLAQRVRAGTLEPGARLPSVRGLAKELLVSVITTQRAYAELEAVGLIVRRQGRGTFVAEDVVQAAAAHAGRRAREELTVAVGRAIRSGLSRGEVTEVVEQTLNEVGGDDV